ncbi:IclR family transcriptional regulator [Hoeflea sp.]|uniref:IclR family transcriptional regulator n=1 Tax=Hoeflea sp. TaxID=1940281 RepID=UPI003BAE720D
MTKTQIANELGKSTSEVFRMLNCLEERGFISVRAPGDGYALTLRMHQLANNWPPMRRLIETALVEMRVLAEETLQSCHLGVYNAGKLYLAAQAESPLPINLSFKIGAEFSLARTASGRVLLAFQAPKVARHWIAAGEAQLSPDERAALMKRIEEVRTAGYELSVSERINGLTDISCPIFDAQNIAVAALTVPFITYLNSEEDIQTVKNKLFETSRSISSQLGN